VWILRFPAFENRFPHDGHSHEYFTSSKSDGVDESDDVEEVDRQREEGRAVYEPKPETLGFVTLECASCCRSGRQMLLVSPSGT
jgi:hypothetical protein